MPVLSFELPQPGSMKHWLAVSLSPSVANVSVSNLVPQEEQSSLYMRLRDRLWLQPAARYQRSSGAHQAVQVMKLLLHVSGGQGRATFWPLSSVT